MYTTDKTERGATSLVVDRNMASELPDFGGWPQSGEGQEESGTETESDVDRGGISVGDASAVGTASMHLSRNTSTDNLVADSLGKPRKASARGGSISIKLLIDEGIIQPGVGVLSMDYKGVSHTADLLTDGKISVMLNGNNVTFDSPSAFSIYLKRLVNPSRKADDGWKSVRYKGNLLEHYKLELARRSLGVEGMTGYEDSMPIRQAKRLKARSDPEPPPSPPRQPRIRRAEHEALGVDNDEYLAHFEDYEEGRQPFSLVVSPLAEAIMDFHAHLCINEVIGILLGKINGHTKTVECVYEQSFSYASCFFFLVIYHY